MPGCVYVCFSGSTLYEETIYIQSSNIIRIHCARPAEPGVLITNFSLFFLHTLCKRWESSTLGLLIMSEFWLCFNCCIAEQPQPKRRRRIDRSMIGEPTNFVHTAHVGSGDLFSGKDSVNSIQNQMQSKGGYGGETMPINVQMQLVDTKAG